MVKTSEAGVSAATPDCFIHPFLLSVQPASNRQGILAMSSTHRYSDAERAAVHRVIAERRDMRHFMGEPIPTEILFENRRECQEAEPCK